MKKFFYVTDKDINSRIDRWFKKVVSNVPQSFIEKNIRKGNIRVNNKKTKSSYKLNKNDIVVFHNLNFTENKNKKKSIRYKVTKSELSSSSNMFIDDNENFVVINKKSGISVQGGTKSKKNLIDIFSKSKIFLNKKPYPVHRLDKSTSGVLIIAKNIETADFPAEAR